MFDIRSQATAALACAGLAFAAPLTAAPPVATMVADIALDVPGPADSTAEFFGRPTSLPATMGPFSYFYGDDGVHGRELWRSDGSPAGTQMVADLCAGRCGSGSRGVFSIARAANRVLFAADDGVHGEELWAIEAPPATPMLIADIVPGARGSGPFRFQTVGSRVFFLARDPVEGSRLWVSDGTSGGTHLVADLVPGQDSWYYQAAADLGGNLVFGAHWPLSGLWRSDGTPEGTYQLSTVVPWQNSWPQGAPFQVFGSKLFFYGQGSPGESSTLWVSDGTAAGTQELSPVEAPWGLTACGDDLFFVGTTPGGGSRQLWRTRGTPATTHQVSLPAGAEIVSIFGWQACADASLVFVATDVEHGTEPWVAGTSSGALLADVQPGPASSIQLRIDEYQSGAGPFFSSLANGVFFLADDGVHGFEPWFSDGTAPGTQLILDSIPGSAGLRTAAASRVLPRAEVDGRIHYFERAPDWTLRLWSSDGAATGTSSVATFESQTSSIPPPIEGLSIFSPPPPSCMSALGDGLLFAADDAQTGRELWFVSTVTGLVSQIADRNPGAAGSSPVGCHAVGNRSVFSAVSDSIDYFSDLLAVDAQTLQVETLAAGAGAVEGEAPAARIDDRLYVALDSVWRTTGMAAETENLGTFEAFPVDVAAANGQLFAGAEQLFVFNSEIPGFVPLTENGTEWRYPARLTPLGDGLVFFAEDPATGFELWKSDGTPEGTLLVADLRTGPAPSVYEEFYFPGRPTLTRLVPLGSIALFSADDGLHGEELWRTDGTAAGTVMVRDLFPGAYPSSPRELTRVGDYVFFSAESVDAGRELWVSNGFSGATRKVADLVPGAGSSVPQELAAIRDELWFSAWTPEFGREPWRLRRGAGNDVVAERLGDLAPGPLSSSPLIFKNAGADVFTVANDNTHGFELWKIRDPDLLFADDFESSGLALWAPAVP